MHYRRILAVWIVLGASVAMAQPPLAEILAKMPAQNAEALQANNAALVQLGAKAVTDLCAMLTPPGKGDNTAVEFALNGLSRYAARPQAEEERRLVAGALLSALQAAADPEVKAFIIRQLQIVGREEAVTPLGALLGDEMLCEPATQALLAIHTPETRPLLAAALKTAQGKNRITLIKAVGELHCEAAQSDLLTLAQGENPAEKEAAFIALAELGTPEAKPLLEHQAMTTTGLAHGRAVANLLLYARQRTAAAGPSECEAICRELLKSNEPATVSSALSQLVWLLRERAATDLLAAVDYPDIEVRGTALRLAAGIPGSDFTRQWMDKANQATPIVRVEILNMLAERGDMTAYSALLAAVKDPDGSVRLAGIQLLPRFAAAETLPALFQALIDASDDAENAAVKSALLRCRDPRLVGAAAEILPRASAPVSKALLGILAARRAEEKAEVVFDRTGDADAGVRMAALEALAGVGSVSTAPRIIALLLDAKNEDEAKAASASLVAALKHSDDTEARVEPVLAACSQAPDDKKPLLLGLLPELGGAKALETATAAAAVPVTRDAAVRALCAWPDVMALPQLNAFMREAPEADFQALAVSSSVRILRNAAAAPEEKAAMYKLALAAAVRPEDKKTLLAGLQELRHIEALRIAVSCLGDDVIKAEAAAAVVKIACPPKPGEAGLTGDEVIAALKQAVGSLQDENLRKKAEAQLANPK